MSNIICRTCLQEIENSSDMYNLNGTEPNLAELTLGQKLAACVPELVLDLTVDAVLCWSCATALRCAYGFRQQCLESEARINTYLQSGHSSIIGDLQQTTEQDDIIFVDTQSSTQSESITIDGSYVLNLEPSQTTAAVEQKSIQCTNEAIVAETKQSCSNSNEPMQSKAGNLYKSPWPSILKELLNDKPYKCTHCDYKTIKSSKFEIHKRVHAAEKFKCLQCGFDSINETDLADHIQSHALERHKCNQCNYETFLRGNIVKHVKTHEWGASCRCSPCNLLEKSAKRKKIVA